MGSRAPNDVESKLHIAAMGNPKKEITAKECEGIIPDTTARAAALNFLLSSGMFKLLKDAKGNVIFRAVSRGELTATKDLNAEESLVLSHIQAAHNEGIWKKHLRAKTNLHSTVIDRCLKTLIKKQLIKHVHSVQAPNNKMYMMAHLEPSVALTGGPWYTDNELDTEFIKLLSTACLRFIQDNSLPKQRSRNENERLIYPLSNSPQYPTAQMVQSFLKKSRITETELSVEHVEMLLNVLVLDGEIEKLPAFGMSMWNSSMMDADDDDESSDSEPDSKRRRKRRKYNDDSSDEDSRSSKRKRSKAKDDGRSSDESDAKTSKSNKSKRSKHNNDSDSENESSDEGRGGKRHKKSKADTITDEESDDDRGRKSKKSKKKKRSRSSSPSSSSSGESDHRSKSRPKSKSSKSKKSRKRSPSPTANNSFSDLFSSGAHVYRAIRQERMSLGWAQAPCGDCPSFEFCGGNGPVNPKECVYYGDWLPEGKAGISVGVKEKLPTVVKDW